MNENIDLTKILKNCPKGWSFYSSLFGEVKFVEIDEDEIYSIVFVTSHDTKASTTKGGKHLEQYDGECTLFPSQEQRDWSKFTASWYNKEKFDPKTLHAFDKILVRDSCSEKWKCEFFSHINDNNDECPYYTAGTCYVLCIPYNEDTKHLVGTTDEAPEYYRYWED